VYKIWIMTQITEMLCEMYRYVTSWYADITKQRHLHSLAYH
jgi:hypothetical protein